jgi:uncharacterized membrane protein YccC
MSGGTAAAPRSAGEVVAGLLTRAGIVVDPRAITPTEGVRAALAVGPFLIARLFLGWPLLTMSALAAFFTCLCDNGGPVNARVRPTIAYALSGSVLVAAMGLARATGPVTAVLVGTCVLFCCAMLRVYGQAGLTVGNLLGVAGVLALDRPLEPVAAVQTAAFFLVGGLWASLLTLAIWRLQPHLPARRALAAAYRALAALAGDVHDLLRGGVTDPLAWEAHARRHRRAVREAIEVARGTVIGAVRFLGAGSNRATQGLIRLEVAEQMFGRLIALSDLLEHGADRPEREAARKLLRRLRPLLLVISRAIVTDKLRSAELLEHATRAMDEQAALLPEGDPERAIAGEIIERVRIAATLAVPANYLPGTGPAGERPPWRQRVLGPLRGNLSRNSLPLRHALRVVALALPALVVTMIWYGPYEHWLTITLVVTMQPYYAQTFTRALERVGGTVLGGLIAAVIGAVLTTPLSMTIGMILFLLIALSVRYVTFGLFIAMLTPMIVLLSESGEPDRSEWVVAAMRGLFTLAGGAIALAGCFLLWPSWEPARLAAELKRGVAAHRAYAEAVLAFLLKEEADVEAARRAAGLASNNAEASLSRALLEPAKLDPARLEAAMVVDAALRRMAGRLSVLQTVQPGPEAAETLRAWRDWIADATRMAETGSGGKLPPRPPLDPAMPGADSLARIARQLELMVDALG